MVAGEGSFVNVWVKGGIGCGVAIVLLVAVYWGLNYWFDGLS
jgi:hypothetical protein